MPGFADIAIEDFKLNAIATALLLFLFPMLFVLVELLQEDHTLDVLDTTIMLAIFSPLIALLLGYGAV